MKKIFLAVLLAFGMALPAPGPSAESLLLVEEALAESADPRTPGKTLIAGLVTGVRKKTGSSRVSLSLRETRIGKEGRPLCDAPTGRFLYVESVTAVVRKPKDRLKSAFVVMGDPPDPPKAEIGRGMCVTVSPEARKTLEKSPEPGIDIVVAGPEAGKRKARLGAGTVTIWSGPPSKDKPPGRQGLTRHDPRRPRRHSRRIAA